MAKISPRAQKTIDDERETFFYVMRLTPTDKKIIQTISPYDRSRRGKTRIEWFEELAPIVRRLKFAKPVEPDRNAMRLELPKKLVLALQKKSEDTEKKGYKKSMVELLILAAREYAKENGIVLPDEDSTHT